MFNANFISNLTHKAFQFFDQSYYQQAEEQFKALQPCLDDYLTHLRPRDRILEIGCGIGLTLAYLLENGFTNLLGIDISDKALREAMKRVPAHYLLKQDFHELNFERANFAAIIAINSLHYTSKKLLPSIFRSLDYFSTPRAHFFLVLPQGEGERLQEEVYRDESGKEEKHLVYHSFFQEEEIAHLLAEGNFILDECRPLQHSAFAFPLLVCYAQKK